MRIRFAIIFSGLIWMAIGVMLLTKGLSYLVQISVHQGFSLIEASTPLFGSEQRAMMGLLTMALVIGFCKGRFVMKRTVNRIVNHIRNLSPFSFKQLYPKSYLFLLGGMMLLGFLFKFLPLPLDIKGLIDISIGFALINGAMLYFRNAF